MKQFVNSGIRRALVLKNTIMTPNKPNSGKRQVVQVVIPKWGYKLYAYVPYKKYPLQKWNRVMITSKPLPAKVGAINICCSIRFFITSFTYCFFFIRFFNF
jgi:ribosomal protein S12